MTQSCIYVAKLRSRKSGKRAAHTQRLFTFTRHPKYHQLFATTPGFHKEKKKRLSNPSSQLRIHSWVADTMSGIVVVKGRDGSHEGVLTEELWAVPPMFSFFADKATLVQFGSSTAGAPTRPLPALAAPRLGRVSSSILSKSQDLLDLHGLKSQKRSGSRSSCLGMNAVPLMKKPLGPP